MVVKYESRRETMRNIQQRIKLRNIRKGTVNEEDIRMLYEFTEKLIKQFGGFVQGAVLFGSVAKKKGGHGDLDLLVIVDDATWEPTPELIGTWRMGIGKILTDMKAIKKIHVTTIGIVQFWDAVRTSDPVIINVIRDGQAIVETGFFRPLKKILELGGFKPSREAVILRMKRAESLITGAKTHLIIAFDDLYWATMDAAHAALLSMNLYPASPDEIVAAFKKQLYKKQRLTPKHIKTLDSVIRIAKDIEHGKKKLVTPDEIKKYKALVEDFTQKMFTIARKSLKKMK